jgi:hypothetical protein
MKQKWNPPQLVILTRNYAEESILSACKGATAGSPYDENANCFDMDGVGRCSACSATVGS